MQNQDYTPKRYILQKDAVLSIISSCFERRSDILISLIPTSFKFLNNFISLTNEKSNLVSFMNNLELSYNFDIDHALKILLRFAQNKQGADVIFFLGTKPKSYDKALFDSISQITNLKIVLFGEAIDMDVPKNYITVSPEENFSSKIREFFGSKDVVEDDDPVLKM